MISVVIKLRYATSSQSGLAVIQIIANTQAEQLSLSKRLVESQKATNGAMISLTEAFKVRQTTHSTVVQGPAHWTPASSAAKHHNTSFEMAFHLGALLRQSIA